MLIRRHTRRREIETFGVASSARGDENCIDDL
jgi:hypothetical protein